MPRFRTTHLVILAALLIFLVPILVGIISARQPLPTTSLIVITLLIFFGMVAEGGVTYWTEHGQRVECQRMLEAKEQELARQKRKLFEAYIEIALSDAVNLLPVPGQARTALYLMDNQKNELFVAYQHNMRGFPDFGLRFRPLVGWAGHVWAMGAQVAYDLAKYGETDIHERWKFTAGQYRVIHQAGVRSVLYTPVFHPNYPDRTIAVFGVDSTESLSETRFDKTEVQDEAMTLATRLGSYLCDGGIV